MARSTEKTNKTVKMESANTPDSNENTNTTASPVTEATVVPSFTATTEDGTDKKLGRPVDTMSKRQKVMLEKAIKEKQGFTSKKGRPVSPDSKRQLTEKEKAEKRANGELKPGRPKYTPEEKAIADAKKKEKKEKELEEINALAAQLLAEGKANEVLAEVEGENVTAEVETAETVNTNS
jgi:hypothetical protein